MMTPLASAVTEGAQRHIVLIDFDWQDADLLPQLLQKPGIAVKLVAGERTEDAGLRMAEVCGLPRTLDLADLTREIFDVALVSDRSPRRARVQSLLEALRTPCLSPGDFLASAFPAAETRDARPEEKAKAPAEPSDIDDALEYLLPAAEPEPTATREDAGARPEPEAAAAKESRDARPEPEPAAAMEDADTRPEPEATATKEGGDARPPRAEAPSETASSYTAPKAPEAPADAASGPVPPDDIEMALERALEGIAEAVVDVTPREPSLARRLQSLLHFPSFEDRKALEEALRQLVANTGAVGAELHAGRARVMELVAQVGKHDPLLEGMVDLALQLNAPQIIKGLSSPNEGRLWGAWPFRTIQHRGVLAASAIDPQGGVSPWEKMVDEMRERWDQHDRESSVRSFPLLPGHERRWLPAKEFRDRLQLAVERNRFDGLAFTLHRLEFPGPKVVVDRMGEGLPQLLRSTDYLCHLEPRHMLLLTAVPADAYTHVRRRLLNAWEQAWRECGQSPPAPPITDLRAEIAGPEDAMGFLASAQSWLSGGDAPAVPVEERGNPPSSAAEPDPADS